MSSSTTDTEVAKKGRWQRKAAEAMDLVAEQSKRPIIIEVSR